MEFINQLCDTGQRHGGRPALFIQGRTYSYSDLYRAVGKVMASLPRTEKNLKIGILTSHSLISYAAILASVLTRNTFVPVNVKQPFPVLESIFSLVKIDLVVIDEVSEKRFPDLCQKIPEKVMALSAIEIQKAPIQDTVGHHWAASDITAYIMFTSGSTGTPKGVEITYDNINNYLMYNQKIYHIQEGDRLSQTFDLSFDLSIFCIFMSWCSGAALYVLPAEAQLDLLGFINENKLTVWFSVPYFIELAKNNMRHPECSTLRVSLFCGEALRTEQAHYWQQLAPMSVVENLYGPTELTISCARYVVPKERKCLEKNGIICIGNLYEGMDFILWSDDTVNQSKGELCVASKQNFKGYLGEMELTEKAHITYQGKKYYRTGDIVSCYPRQLFFCGRKDTQIKRRGYRIELGFIEYHLRQLGAEQAICVYDATNEKITAYIVGFEQTQKLKAKMAKCLPSYMFPDKIISIAAKDLPRHHNYKLNKKPLT